MESHTHQQLASDQDAKSQTENESAGVIMCLTWNNLA